MRWLVALLAVCCFGQNYASYSTYPVARMSFLRSQTFSGGILLNDSSLLQQVPITEGGGVAVYNSKQGSGGWSGTTAGTSGYYAQGKTGKFAGVFDGSTNYITMPNLVSGGSSFTILAWLKATTTPTAVDGIAGVRIGSNYYALTVSSAVSGIVAYSWGNNPLQYGWNSGLSFVINQWALYGIVISTTQADAYLLNGSSVGHAVNSIANSSPSFSSNPLVIGEDPFGGGRLIAANMNDVRIYNRALSQAEIQAIYNAENH